MISQKTAMNFDENREMWLIFWYCKSGDFSARIVTQGTEAEPEWKDSELIALILSTIS